jgi:phospholipase/carboxylesterase
MSSATFAAPVPARRGSSDPGSHGLSAATAQPLSGWIAHRLRFIHERGHTTVAPQGRAPWPTLPGGELPERKGARPDVSWSIPQQQVSDNAPVALQEKVFAYAAGLFGSERGALADLSPRRAGFHPRRASSGMPSGRVTSALSSR